ncbi:MAG: IPT/TIG domain-containing protein [Bacteroidetes bacterium]|nr:IPT/TIG domain-containing protein [Bacteroidota bacterium]
MTNPDNEINTLHLNQNNLIVGGKFNNIDNKVVNFLAAFQAPYPFISLFYPTTAFTNETIIIYGKNFTGASKVTFSDVDALSFKLISDNEIHAIVGAGATGLVKVATPIGLAIKNLFTFLASNTITSIQTNQIIIYPNPVTNVLNIKLKAETKNSRFKNDYW